MTEFQVVKKKGRKGRKNAQGNGIADRIRAIGADMKSSEFYTETLGLIVKHAEEIRALARLTENKSSPGCNGHPNTAELEADTESDLANTVNHVTTETTEEHAVHSAMADSIVCYGLGNFADCYIARYQLAFLLALRSDLQVPLSRCYVYDPQFTQEEVNMLEKQGLTVLHHNEEGKRGCEGLLTLCYMPHCGKALYNNLLWKNWGPALANLIVIGNSFTRMLDSTPSRVLRKTANYVMKVHPYCKETELPVSRQYDDVFNDTSIHTFLYHTRQEVKEELWEDNVEPVYDEDDAEIIVSYE